MTATIPQITAPGVYDLPAAMYHKDPVKGGSLSSSGARRLLPPSCPAIFRYEQRNPPPPSAAMLFGTAAHAVVLEGERGIEVVDAPNWLTGAAKAAKKEILSRGGIPVLPRELETLRAMAAEVHAHPIASALLARDRGRPEQTLIWRDGATGVWRRALLDWLPHPHGGRVILVDYKTTADAAPAEIAKSVHDYGYGQQSDWYLDGLKALGLAGQHEPAFVFVFQQKTPPYLITVAELDAPAMRIAAAKNRRALEIYAECTRTGYWPGHADDVVQLALPAWAEIRDSEEYL